ncbi:MAG: glycosyltransferase [Alphaproteobacteria bacterium]|nr:glycosyltransferase [Alphaproteobacteria bacterium]
MFLRVARHSAHVRVIGSALADGYVPDLAEIRTGCGEHLCGESVPTLVAWGLGVRDLGGISDEERRRVEILAVRGPISAAALRLEPGTPMGDPGLLLPALFRPSSCPEVAGKSVCVPHFLDGRTNAAIRDASGCDQVLRPSICGNFNAIEKFINSIAGADFVLSSSLHAGIVALAYGVPFAFWRADVIDVPLKWEDFAASVNIRCEFVSNLSEGRRLYCNEVRDSIRIPSLWPLVAASPYPIRPDALLKILKYELRNEPNDWLQQHMAQRIELLEAHAPRFAAIANESRRIISELDNRSHILANSIHVCEMEEIRNDGLILEANTEILDLEAKIVKLEKELASQCKELAAIKESTAWRMVDVLRKVRSRIPRPLWLLVRRMIKAAYWGATPHRTAARFRFLRARALSSARPSFGLGTSSQGADERRILVADYRIPMSEISAGERATVGILSDLAELGFEVVFLPSDMIPSPKHEMELEALGIEVVTKESGCDSAIEFLRTHGHEFATFYLIRMEVAESMVPAIRNAAPKARVIFHAPDLYSLRELREAALERDRNKHAKALETRRREATIMKRVDHVAIVSGDEMRYLSAETSALKVSVFPALYVPVERSPRGFSYRRDLFYLGGFSHSPNVGAVGWFVKEIWPSVLERLPYAQFHIIGSEAPPEVIDLGRHPGVKVVGFVPDLTEVLAHMRVGVAPLLYGAGIKGKLGVMMGAGIPCVCTDIASEGMHIRDGVHALIRNNSADFADAVVQLYNDGGLWVQLSMNGRLLIERHFGSAANRGSLLRLLNAARALPIKVMLGHWQGSRPCSIVESTSRGRLDVSIIIPVHNRWRQTTTCLNSIIETMRGSDVDFEIILADDASDDSTVEAEIVFPGLRIVRSSKNLGFLKNCNNASKAARGEYLVLLSNEMIVLPGWLESLKRVADNDATIAIAGSKILYPSGEILEAGGGLFDDGTAIKFGRGSDRDAPIFNLRREVDYIGSGSMLVRKAFWDEVGGFDERFKNGGCEDCDLAMTARSRGMRVSYEPASEVVYFVGSSDGDEELPSTYGIQSNSVELLREKWREVFAKDHGPVGPWHVVASRAERRASSKAIARRKGGRLNILYFSPVPSHPTNHGNRATVNQFATSMRDSGHRVHFALLESYDYGPHDLEDMRAAWDTVDILPFSTSMDASGAEIPFDSWYEEGLGERIRCLCDRYDIDVVFCSYVFQSKLLEFVPSHVLKVIDTHDKMGNRFELLRKAGFPLEFFSCTPRDEGRYLRRADLVVARRAEEASYFDSVRGSEGAIVIPHVEPPRYVTKRFDRVVKVGIVASANRINLGIVSDFISAVDLRLAGERCPFTVHVVGQVADMVREIAPGAPNKFDRQWVLMRGFVPNIEEFYSEIDLVVAPVMTGTGINVKTVQAMAFGMPLLATECGSKGIETGEAMHQHKDLTSLVESLFDLQMAPTGLARLAEVSRARYTEFYLEGRKGFDRIFQHPILTQYINH